jgi:hypothetical protein
MSDCSAETKRPETETAFAFWRSLSGHFTRAEIDELIARGWRGPTNIGGAEQRRAPPPAFAAPVDSSKFA